MKLVHDFFFSNSFSFVGDLIIGYALEINYFEGENAVEVNISYPKTGIGKIVVNCVEVQAQAVKI